jgi:tripartite-type tricarboxylate transporter receptor subunit TctC
VKGLMGPLARLIGIFAVMCGTAAAQQWPNRPVKLVVAYPPGGSSDLMARIVAAKFTDLWGQQVLVENKPGAAGAIGTDYAAKQPPDGYSFMIANLGPAAVNPLLSSVPYNIDKDFIAVSQISQGPNVLVVRADAPYQSLKDIIDFGRANPGKLSYGTSGPGSVSHLSSEMLKNITKIQATEIPYKGGVDAVKDMLGGQIDFIFSDTLPAMAHVRAGKLRGLCITGTEKFELLPDQPSCQVAAPGLVAINWWGILVPAGTPRAVVTRLHDDWVKLAGEPDVKDGFAKLGVIAVSSTPEEFRGFIRREMDKYGKLIKEANIKVNP